MVGRLLVIILLTSCNFNRSIEKEVKLFESNLFLKLTPTFRAKLINQEYLNSEKEINKPFFTSQPILEFDSIGDEGISIKSFCLIYRIPSAKGFGGLIKLSENSCGKPYNEFEYKLFGINKLFLWLSPISLNKDNEKIKPFTLTMIFEKNKKKYKFEIPLLNLFKEEIYLAESKKIRSSSISTLRFSNGILPTYLPGVTFFPIKGENLNGKKIEMIGEISDNYASGSSKFCHRINENCESIGEYRCEQCRFGWYETVPTKCPLAGDKICGIDKCGEKGFPACFRGFRYGFNQILPICGPENKSAFCQNDLNLICDSQGILVCD